MRKEALIIGAGLAGLSTAYHLKRYNVPYRIFEKESLPGGLCRTVREGGFSFDYTNHLLHTRTGYVRDLIERLLRGNLKKIKRDAWIYSSRRYIPYPFQANIYGLSAKAKKRCISGFLDTYKDNKGSRKSINERGGFYSFQNWVLENFGKGFAEYFFFPYNKKLWKVPLRELSVEWMDRFVPVPSIKEILAGALMHQDKSFGYNVSFLYPERGGIQALIESLAQNVEDIRLSKRLVGVSLRKKIAVFKDGDIVKFNTLISTVPLKEFILSIVEDAPIHIRNCARDLRHNSILNVNLGFNRNCLSDKHWIYFPEMDYVFYRIGFPGNFSIANVPKGMSSISVEISYLSGKRPTKYIAERVLRDLKKCGVIERNERVKFEKTLNIKYGYVIFDNNYGKVKAIKDFLAKNGIFSIGRYGGWNYSTMEDAILDGKKTAEEIKKTNEAQTYGA